MTTAASYSTFLHGLPPIAQPMVSAFVITLPVWIALMIYERHRLAKHGPSPVRKTSLWLVLPCYAALFWLGGRYPAVAAILDWPENHIPGWRLHWWQWGLGALGAGYAAKGVGAVYAALFLRGDRQSRGGIQSGAIVPSGFNMLPDPPPGYGWYRDRQPRQGITRTRTFHIGEDEP